MESMMEIGDGAINWADEDGGSELRRGCHHHASNMEEYLLDQMMVAIDADYSPCKSEESSKILLSCHEYMQSQLYLQFDEIQEQFDACVLLIDRNKCHFITSIQEINCRHCLVDIELASMGSDQCLRDPFHRGDIMLLSVKPIHGIGDKQQFCVAMVAEDEDENFHTIIKVRIMPNSKISSESYKYATIIDVNVQKYVDSLLSAYGEIENENKCIINSIIQWPDVVADRCSDCINLFDTSIFIKDLDEYQMKAVESTTLSLSCTHLHHNIQLIKGPQSSGKTKVLSTLLLSVSHTLRCVVYVPTISSLIGLLSEMKDLCMSHNQFEHFCQKVLVFERTSGLGDEYGYMSFESHVTSTAKFSGIPGWKFSINRALQILQDYNNLYQALSKRRKASYLDIFTNEFVRVSKQLKDCIHYLLLRVRDSSVKENMVMLKKSWKEMEELLGHADMDDCCMRQAFQVDSDKKLDAIAEKLDSRRNACINLLKTLKNSLELPTFDTLDEVEQYCINNAPVIFCSIDQSFFLREKVKSQIDCLIIDDAHTLNESETIVPLCLPALRSVILAGDHGTSNCQGCQEDGYGPSLFERLLELQFKQHLLHENYKPKRLSGQNITTPKKPKVRRREFSWVERPINSKYILAPIRNQGSEETCCLHSTMALTESLYKLAYATKVPPADFNVILDIQDMLKKYKAESGYEYGKEPRGKRGLRRVDIALEVLRKYGVMGTYESGNHDELRDWPIQISSFERVDPTNTKQVHELLLKRELLVAAVKISYNYFEVGPGEVYHFDQQRPLINARSNNCWLHAVMIVGHVDPTETCHPPDLATLDLVYQNSFGKLFGFKHGFGRVGYQSIKCFWVANIKTS